MVPKSQVLGLQKRVEELERATGLIPCHTPWRDDQGRMAAGPVCLARAISLQ